MKKMMLEKDEKEFMEMVIGFAEEKSMTISNIKEAVEKVISYMNDNATCGAEKAEKEGAGKEEKDLPREILKMIFNEYPDGISVGEIKDILNEARKIAEDIPMV